MAHCECRMRMKSLDNDGVTTFSFILPATNCYSSPSSSQLRNTKLILPYQLSPSLTHKYPYAPIAWEPFSRRYQDVMCSNLETNPEGHADPLRCPVVNYCCGNDNCCASHWVLCFNNYNLAAWFFIVREVSS